MVEKLVEISIINSLVVSLILRGYTKLNKNTINVASELSTIHCVTTLSNTNTINNAHLRNNSAIWQQHRCDAVVQTQSHALAISQNGQILSDVQHFLLNPLPSPVSIELYQIIIHENWTTPGKIMHQSCWKF